MAVRETLIVQEMVNGSMQVQSIVKGLVRVAVRNEIKVKKMNPMARTVLSRSTRIGRQ